MVSAGVWCGENWCSASGEKRCSGCLLALGGLVVVSRLGGIVVSGSSRAFHVGGFGGPRLVSAEFRWSRRSQVLRASMLVSAVSVVSGLVSVLLVMRLVSVLLAMRSGAGYGATRI